MDNAIKWQRLFNFTSSLTICLPDPTPSHLTSKAEKTFSCIVLYVYLCACICNDKTCTYRWQEATKEGNHSVTLKEGLLSELKTTHWNFNTGKENTP